MSLFQRFDSDFAPMFRLLDDYGSHVQRRGGNPLGNGLATSMKTFQPRFDIKETKDAYELHGELPGLEQRNISVEFTDANTISIKGRTESAHEEGLRPAGYIEGESEQSKLTEEKSHQPTVEDEPSASGNAEVSAQQGNEADTQVAALEAKPQFKYWLSERTVGEFHRSFSLPSKIDQDKVSASLKNGILSITVPKSAAPTARRINIE